VLVKRSLLSSHLSSHMGTVHQIRLVVLKGQSIMIFFAYLLRFSCEYMFEVAPGSTLYFLTSLNGIVRVTKQTTGKP
jgi:hypothetical protein